MSEIVMAGEKISIVLLDYASFACWNDQAKRFHDAADLIGKFGRHMDQPGAHRTSVRANMLPKPFTRTSRKNPTSAGHASPSASFASVLFVAMSRAALACRSIQMTGRPSSRSA
jgi:hypothetical protein